MCGAHGHPISTPDICRWCSPGRKGCPLSAATFRTNRLRRILSPFGQRTSVTAVVVSAKCQEPTLAYYDRMQRLKSIRFGPQLM